MEMTLESLTASGLSQEQAQSVLDAHKATLAGNYIPKARFDEVSSSLKERDSQIANLKQFEGTAQELQQKVGELEKENQQKEQEYLAALSLERKKSAMAHAVEGRVQDVDLVLSLIDVSKVCQKDDGTLDGFDDQIQELQEKKGFLFIADSGNGSGGFRIAGKTPEDSSHLGTPKLSEAQAYGKQIAEERLAEAKRINSGAQTYFKID